MGDLENLTRLPDGFDGRVRLFPLPSLVLFPHAMQPLHLFEPRYCDMLEDALETDELIAMATLREPVEPEGSLHAPPIAPIICVGKIVTHVALENRRHNILLVGIKRAKILNEEDTDRPYRTARVEILEDSYAADGAPRRGDLRSSLLNTFASVLPSNETVQKGLNELLAGSMELGPVSDIIAHTLPIPTDLKLNLLAESDVDRRARSLIDFLGSGEFKVTDATSDHQESSREGRPPFPPPFSTN